MSGKIYFATRLAWRQMIFGKAKLLAAVLGVVFACVLVFMQLGFLDSLFASAASAPLKMKGDLFLVHKQTEAVWRTASYPKRELIRVLGHEEVEAAYPMYIALTPFKNPETQTKRTLQIYGYDPDAYLIDDPAIFENRHDLRLSDTALFDRTSRPEFGPIEELLSEGPLNVEINNRKLEILDVFTMGTSFAADGNIIVSDLNFQRIFPGRNMEQIDLGVIQLREGADPLVVKENLGSKMSDSVQLFTQQELLEYEQKYWEEGTPIGFIFGFGTAMGLIVGMIIVYQILFTDITNHLKQYATLKAIGYTQGYLIYVVFASAFILAFLGFVPGLFISLGLYNLAESAIFIPMPMSTSKILMVFGLISGMCAISGLLAIQKLRAANPADMF